MNPTADSSNIHRQQNITNTEIIHRIDRIIDDLELIREQYLASH